MLDTTIRERSKGVTHTTCKTVVVAGGFWKGGGGGRVRGKMEAGQGSSSLVLVGEGGKTDRPKGAYLGQWRMWLRSRLHTSEAHKATLTQSEPHEIAHFFSMFTHANWKFHVLNQYVINKYWVFLYLPFLELARYDEVPTQSTAAWAHRTPPPRLQGGRVSPSHSQYLVSVSQGL